MQLENPRTEAIVCFATQGSGSSDESRIRELLAPLSPTLVSVPRGRRHRDIVTLIRRLRDARPRLVVMEGTGVAGGVVVLLLRALRGTPYVVSSGDAVAPFLASIARPLGALGLGYEALLYRCSSGFIGWSPYLVGRALTFGAPRAMTAPNWAPNRGGDGAAVRDRLGIAGDALVFGIVGSLNWTRRYGYCYGWELVKAAATLDRDDVRVLIVGDGNGRRQLEELAGPRLGHSILLPGAVARSEVGGYLDAMNVASLPQSVDGVGSFRYTTKISEYLAARLPIVTGQVPLAYDLDEGWMWRLPGDAPWDPRYVAALRALMSGIDRPAIEGRRPAATAAGSLFDRDRQVREAVSFVLDVLAREG